MSRGYNACKWCAGSNPCHCGGWGSDDCIDYNGVEFCSKECKLAYIANEAKEKEKKLSHMLEQASTLAQEQAPELVQALQQMLKQLQQKEHQCSWPECKKLVTHDKDSGYWFNNMKFCSQACVDAHYVVLADRVRTFSAQPSTKSST